MRVIAYAWALHGTSLPGSGFLADRTTDCGDSKKFRKTMPFILKKKKFIFIFLKREKVTEVNCSGSWESLKQYLCMNVYIAILLGYLTLQCE